MHRQTVSQPKTYRQCAAHPDINATPAWNEPTAASQPQRWAHSNAHRTVRNEATPSNCHSHEILASSLTSSQVEDHPQVRGLYICAPNEGKGASNSRQCSSDASQPLMRTERQESKEGQLHVFGLHGGPGGASARPDSAPGWMCSARARAVADIQSTGRWPCCLAMTHPPTRHAHDTLSTIDVSPRACPGGHVTLSHSSGSQACIKLPACQVAVLGSTAWEA
jgi:hypothetical protein